MAAEYYILVKDTSGNPIAEIDDFLQFSCARRVREPGLLKVQLDGNSSKIQYLTTNSQLELYRRNQALGIDWYCEFRGLHRGEERTTDKDGKDAYQLIAPGQMTMLSWAYVAYQDKIANRSVFTQLPIETIMKTLVSYNVNSTLAVNNHADPTTRVVSWPIAGISSATDQSRGPVTDWKAAWKNLLVELQALAQINSAGDFDLLKTGAATWQFQYYPGQLGADRRSTVLFALENGNMANPEYKLDKTSEATIAIVGGRGDGSARQYEIVTGAAYSSTNYIEAFVHASNQDTVAYMTAKGQDELYKKQARNKLIFDVLQTQATAYGRDYFLGDLVTANYKSVHFSQKVNGVTLTLNANGQETIQVEMQDA